MEDWQKDLLSTFAEVKLKEAIEWLLCEWRADIREIPKLFGELYTDGKITEWIWDGIWEVEDLTRDPDEEFCDIQETDGYINEEGDWIAYPWGEDDA